MIETIAIYGFVIICLITLIIFTLLVLCGWILSETDKTRYPSLYRNEDERRSE